MLGFLTFIWLHSVAIVGLVLALIGGLHLYSTDPSKQRDALSLMKAGNMVSFFVFLLTAALAVWVYLHYRSALPYQTKPLLSAVLLAIPFLFVRYLYGILSVFINHGAFAFGGGSPWAYLVMAVIMEFIISILYLGAGANTRAYKAPGQKVYRSGSENSKEGAYVERVEHLPPHVGYSNGMSV
jgi:hypothetical protein